ncbi:hypothetical protein GCM10010406_39920 [Streptomyces thermolineatus]|uniref:Cyclodeaminase/cyclohydrolase domain-containing protein n=1 Tax=Streptomyces thermolineatus TaxID=44033 RepID=A0ABN3MEF2_9ACTN
MDATALVEAARHALAHARGAGDVAEEAWQAQALAEAVGGHLSLYGPAELKDAALSLGETAGRACAGLHRHHAGARGGPVRAARLSRMRDPVGALRALDALLAEAGAALLAVACALEDEQAHAGCVDAVDAVSESREEVARLLGRCGRFVLGCAG